MLDHEPDHTDNDQHDTPAEAPPEAPRPRRRRAASRPAGPPTVREPEPEQPAEPAAEAEPPAERPKRTRRTTKKAAPPEPLSEPAEPPISEPAEPPVSEPVEEPAPPLSEPVGEPAPTVSEPVDEPAPTVSEPVEEPAPTLPEPVEGPAPTVSEPVEEPTPTLPEPVEGPTDSDDSDSDDADSEDSDEEDADSDSAEDDEHGPRRRRRRRGGRRRRRSGGGEESANADEQESDAGEAAQDSTTPAGADHGEDGKPADAEGSTDGGSDADDESGESGRRRRRRRRRRGEESTTAPDDPSDTVVRVREPRARRQSSSSTGSSEVTGISGSTRMEAKRLRRREGREAGRRRAPILSEAEFLARRESVSRKMIVRQRSDDAAGGTLSQIAVVEDDILVEHYVDRESAASLIGNVYLGRVQNVLPSMEAAFIDIGRGRNAVLYAGEIDWDAFGAEGQQRKVENVLKSGQTVLVQVTKDPVGAKGARLTAHVSIPGRYIVYAPGGHLSGISRKLPDTERRRLKNVLSELVPESASVIVRTAAEGASEDELVRDVNRLKAQWEAIERKVKAGSAPQLLYGEPDLTVRIVRDLFTEDFSELIVQGDDAAQVDAYESIEAYVGHVAPHLHDRLRRWNPDEDGDLFGAFRLDEQIAKGLERKVFLPSGGSLVIDRTEAMTVIDVNTGKFTGSGGNLEATVTSNNLEAAEEIVRQLRLRDLGGIIVIDFIDMVLPSNRELLLRRLVECLGRDRTRHQVAEVTSLGLVQMTRKRIGTGLLEAFSTECEHCHGRGYEIHDMPVATQKQADGGARERGGRGGRGGNSGGGSGNNGGGNNGGGRGGAQHAEHEEGGRRGRRGGRSRGNADEQPAPETPDHSDEVKAAMDQLVRAQQQQPHTESPTESPTEPVTEQQPEPAPVVLPTGDETAIAFSVGEPNQETEPTN